MKTKSNRRLSAALASSTSLIAPGLCLAILAGPTIATAQDTTAPAKAAPEAQEVIVTGSLFRSRVVTAAPVTVLTNQTIAKKGITTVADAVRSIPSDNSGTLPPAFPGAFAFGASGVALRGLTVNSTLVLTDGIRNADYPIGDDGVRSFVDLNTLPLAAVQRIDVLKDGASSLYGADAIGGVVNIILKPTFQGVEGTLEGGGTQHGGDTNEHLDITVGHGDLDTDRYNVYISGEYQHDDAIRAYNRPFPFNTSDLSPIGGPNPGNGQPSTTAGSIYGAVAPATLTGGSILSGVQTGPYIVEAASGCGRLGTLTTAPGETTAGGVALGQDSYCAQNLSGDYLWDYPEETRGGVYGRFTAQITPHTQGYVSFSYYENKVYQPQIHAEIQSGTPNNTDTIALPATLPGGALNPNDPFAAMGQAALINYAFGDIPEYFTTDDKVYRGVAELKGDVGGWDYDVSAAAEHEDLFYTQAGFLYYPQLIADVTNGTYNFKNPSLNSAATRAALGPAISKTATSDLETVDAFATRPLFDLYGGPLNLGLGVHADYEAEDNPELNPNGLYQGLGVDHAFGNRYVLSAYGELDAPLLSTVDLNLSGRFDHYSDFGDAFSPKATIKWTPIKQIALRATYSQGFRAPSFAESGTSAVGGFVTETPSKAEPAYYAAHNGDGYVQPYALEEVSIANPHIKPEHSQSFTVGGVFQPVPWLSASLDYYYIQKTDLIAPGSQGPALAAYFAGTALPAGDTIIADTADPSAPGAGGTGYVAGLSNLNRPIVIGTEYTNENKLITDGIDVEINAHFNLPYDAVLTTDFNWTDIFRYNYSTPGVPTFNYVGTESPYNLSSGAGTPQYRWTWQTSLTYGPATITGIVNYTSSIFMDGADVYGNTGCVSPSTFNADGDLPANCRAGSFTDFDLTGDYKLNSKIDLFANVYNVFDAKPPLDPINYAGINYNPTYAEAGIIGRAFKIGVHVRY